MKQLIESYVSIIVIMCIICVSMQIVMINTQVTSAKEYSSYITEKLENSGLSEKAKNKIVEATNESKFYNVQIDKAETNDGKASYHIALKYPVMTPFFDMFSKNTTVNTGVINSYASVGNANATSSDGLGLGDVESTYELDNGITISIYKNETVAVISGEGSFDNEFKDIESNVFQEEINTNSIEIVYVEKGITAIDDYSFANLNNLTQVILPSTLESIGDYAFAKTAISAINIPHKITTLTYSMFENANNLDVIYVDNKKEDVDIEDLTDKNKETEIAFLR